MWVDMWFLESWLVIFLYVGAIFSKTITRSFKNGHSRIYKFWCQLFFYNIPQWAFLFTRIVYHNQRRTTVGRTPLDERSVCHRDLYLTTHSTHYSQTSMTPAGFEPTISADQRPHNYALDCAATANLVVISTNIKYFTCHRVLINFRNYC